MKKTYYRYYLIIPFLSIFFTGCFFLIPKDMGEKKRSSLLYVKDLNKSNFNETLTVYGRIDPKLKVTLTAVFEATVTKEGCFNRLNNGWPAFVKNRVVDESSDKEEFKLTVPIEWNKSFGDEDCKFELEGISFQVSYPKKKYIDEPIDLLLGSNNESYFRIDAKGYYNLARDYKVRYLTGLSNLNCLADINSDPKFYCESGLSKSNIKKSDFLPSSLSYGVNIFLRER